jgi:tRNA1Val (adenine37-N6)-methyltransferase
MSVAAKFRFKQFSIDDSKCAMKIGTDGVLLGAFNARLAEKLKPANMLDVGTGCGIVALMTAQKCTAHIDAIDIGKAEAETAEFNFSQSPWNDRLRSICSPLGDFFPDNPPHYGLISCNPPYFRKSMASPDLNRTIARHDHSLNYDELFMHCKRLLSVNGAIVVIFPSENHNSVVDVAKTYGFFCNRNSWISSGAGKSPIRVISIFNLFEDVGNDDFFSIDTGKRHEFTEEYKDLTRDYHPFF